jgi:hypothetical protein
MGRRDTSREFKPGQSGNPAGRPAGSRSRLQGAFLRDLADAWEKEGKAAIAIMVKEEPTQFVKVCAGLMPKEVALDVSVLAAMSDEELAERLARLDRIERALMADKEQATGETLN